MNSFESEALRMRALNRLKSSSDGNAVAFIVGIIFFIIIFTIIFVPASIYFALAYGFVLSKLWSWFLVPLGLPVIGALHAAGIMGLVRLMTHDIQAVLNQKVTNDDEEETYVKIIRWFSLLLIPWVSLAVGAVIHRFM
jgi:hypothetical protein